VDAKLTDSSKMLTLTNSLPLPVFNQSSKTNLFIRKDDFNQGTSFCTEFFLFFDAFQLAPGAPASGCVQKGFSFAPSSTNTAAPMPGADIWLSGVSVAESTGGNFVASAFEGFTADVKTAVPAVDGDEVRVTLKNGPYKMSYSKTFDAANSLRFVPAQAGGSAAVFCMFGKYTP
jgi:hypothetical protein